MRAQEFIVESDQTAKIFHPQKVDVYFLNGARRTPTLVNSNVPYYLIDKYLEMVTKKYNLQQSRFEFRNAEEALEEEQLDELTFMGMSPCTKDCSGHRAGYRWSKARGGVSTASQSNSFNKGAEIARAGY